MHLSIACINRWAMAPFGVLLLVHVVYGNVNSICDPSVIPMTLLDIAVDMITKVKDSYSIGVPECCNSTNKPMDCEELLESQGKNQSGVYTVWPRNRVTGDRPLDVYCDMDTDGGGWLVLQRRGNYNHPHDYFFNDWQSYKNGFGNIDQDFWLGNDNIFALTSQRQYSIRFDLTAIDGETRYALYDTFWIDNENNKYTLHIQDYSGNAGDSMIAHHDNMRFSTRDQDNDNDSVNCAETYKGAWWYNACHHANLNGLYLYGQHESFADGINWETWRGYKESLHTVEMKIRPKNFKKPVEADDKT